MLLICLRTNKSAIRALLVLLDGVVDRLKASSSLSRTLEIRLRLIYLEFKTIT